MKRVKGAKRYFLSFIEEAVMNPAYSGCAGGRIEVYDAKSASGYAVDEIGFLTRRADYYDWRDKHDFKAVGKWGLAKIKRQAAGFRDGQPLGGN